MVMNITTMVHRVWGNEDVPFMHVDPVFPACAAGERVTLNGRMWFSSEENIEAELNSVEPL